jgi:hypothetical protein
MSEDIDRLPIVVVVEFPPKAKKKLILTAELFVRDVEMPADCALVLKRARTSRFSGLLFASFVAGLDKVAMRRAISASVQLATVKAGPDDALVEADFLPVLWQKAQGALTFRKS